MLKRKTFITAIIILFVSILIYLVFNNYKEKTKVNGQSIELKNKTQEDKIIIRLEKAIDILEKNNLEAYELAQSCLLESQKLGNKYLKMRSYHVLGMSIIDVDKIKISQIYYNNALSLSEEIEDNWYRGAILYRKAKNEYRLNDTKLSLETFNEALYYCQLSNNFKIIGATYSMIGTIYRINGAYSKAIEYFIK
ncbi:MAG: tetratricopeptide repeat protein [Lutibacter sp.]|nr:tetratricopeptide repeat protein [Lutibacter sp.]